MKKKRLANTLENNKTKAKQNKKKERKNKKN